MENDKAIKMEYKFDQWLNENNDVVEIDGEHYEPAIVLLRTDGEKYMALLRWFSEHEDEATYDTRDEDGKKVVGLSSVEMYRE